MDKKVIVISGGSQGLGEAMTKTFCAERNQVVILARSEEKMKVLADTCGCDFRVCDVTNPQMCADAVQGIIDAYGKIDVLINNAGIYRRGELDANTPEDVAAVLQVNTLGTMYLTQAALPFMKKEQGGDIINIISTAGLSAKQERTIYNTSKWAVTGFTKNLRKDVAQYGIRAMALYPGLMKTNIFKNAGVERVFDGSLETQDVANLICFMVSQPRSVVLSDVTIEHIHHV